jgi:hypothetical protein
MKRAVAYLVYAACAAVFVALVENLGLLTLA